MHQMCGQKRHHTPSGICWFWGDKKANQSRVGRGGVGGKDPPMGYRWASYRRIPRRREGLWDCPSPALGRVGPRCRECPGAQTHLGRAPFSTHVGWGGRSPAWGKRESPPPWMPRRPTGRHSPLARCVSRSLSPCERVPPASPCPRSGAGPKVRGTRSATSWLWGPLTV